MPFQQLPHDERDGLGLVPPQSASRRLGGLFDQGNDIRAIDCNHGWHADPLSFDH
jgi:hypothetical protein